MMKDNTITNIRPFSQINRDARTVLFVDDEPQSCKWFARMFSDEFTIITAGGTDEALQILDEHGSDIAVLLTDYRMPVRDGLDLLTAARHEYRHVVRLLATAYAEKNVAVAAINQGRVLTILEKPFDELQVRNVLREALEDFCKREREYALLDVRAAAMRDTLGFLAHELSAPLAAVLGDMDALKSRYLAPHQQTLSDIAKMTENRAGDALAMITAVEQRTQYALSLVETFVQSARNAHPRVIQAPVKASRLINALLDGYPFENDDRASVSWVLGADFELPGHHDLLYLVLCTLTKNALRALRGVSRPSLHITLERIPGIRAGAMHTAICFTDNGPGMAPEILARVTQEPVTTQAAMGGSGMGLLFCRRVMQSMHGLIEVRSDVGRGVCVSLLFKPDENPERVTS
jgi:two-component system response regulator PhcR